MTVLFSDASGYTQMAESVDTEVVRELMNLVYDKAGEIVTRYGGRIDKLMGDAVLAVFGDPVAHEDDAVRAVRSAIELHAAVSDLRPTFEARTGHSFEMHSGVNSGVVITSDLRGDRASGPLGDMVNVAARLQSLATAGEIYIGPETRALVAGRFALTDLGDRELKGRREPVRVTRVDGLRTAQARPSRRFGGFVGRQEELGVLLGAVDRLRDGESSLITVCAEAGAGKTRLLEEVRSRLGDDVQWYEGRAYPYTADIPYAPLVDLFNNAASIDENDDAAQVREKLTTMVSTVLPGDDLALAAIGQLYGTTPVDGAVDPEAFQSVLRGAVVRLLDVVAGRAPTVVCLQDLHWVDPSTAALVRDLTGALSQPVVTICNFRPGFVLGAPGERSLFLSELSARQSREQLTSLLDGAEPPDELVAMVTARADGNPFFVEELVNTLVDDGVLARRGETWVLATSLDAVTVPSTIRGLIAARIDNLAPEPRRVLREASVVGREFLYRIMQSVTDAPQELEQSLAGLSAADLIHERKVDTELEYIFKHALTQEVAYDGLLRRDRQELHERVARGIEAHLGGRANEFVETLAYHYQRSGHVVEAVDYLRRSGRKALDRYALAEAHRQYRAAYDLLTSDDEDTLAVDAATRDRLLIETIIEWAQCHYYTCEIGPLRDLQERHRDLPAAVGDDMLTARWIAWVGMVTWQLERITDADRYLTEALALARRCGDATAEGYALAWLTWVAAQAGDLTRVFEAGAALERVVPLVADPQDRLYVQIKGLGGVGGALARHGDAKAATACADELLEIGQRTGNRRAAAMGHMVAMAASLSRGDEYAAKAATRAAIACDADPMYVLFARAWATGISIGGDSMQESRRELAELDLMWRETGATVSSSVLAGFGHMLDVLDGHPSRGMARLAELRADREAAGDYVAVTTIDVFAATVQSRLATGDVGGAAVPPASLRDKAFIKAHRVGASKKARVALEQLARLLADRQENGRLAAVELELAKVAKHDGRNDDARAHVQTVQRLLAGSPDASLYLRARGILAELG